MPRTKALSPEEVRSAARAYTMSMLRVLVSIAQDKLAPPAPRVSAATAVLDRGWGKPDQQVSSKSEITVIVRKLMSSEPLTIDALPERLPEPDAKDE